MNVLTDEQMDNVKINQTQSLLESRFTPQVPAAEPQKNKGGRPKGYSPKTRKIETPTEGKVNTSTESTIWLQLFSSMISGAAANASAGVIKAVAIQADIALKEYQSRYKG